jgi:hypothetical protein
MQPFLVKAKLPKNKNSLFQKNVCLFEGTLYGVKTYWINYNNPSGLNSCGHFYGYLNGEIKELFDYWERKEKGEKICKKCASNSDFVQRCFDDKNDQILQKVLNVS